MQDRNVCLSNATEKGVGIIEEALTLDIFGRQCGCAGREFRCATFLRQYLFHLAEGFRMRERRMNPVDTGVLSPVEFLAPVVLTEKHDMEKGSAGGEFSESFKVLLASKDDVKQGERSRALCRLQVRERVRQGLHGMDAMTLGAKPLNQGPCASGVMVTTTILPDIFPRCFGADSMNCAVP